MIRTVWLAAVCLVVLGAMAIGKTAKTPAPITDETSVDGATVDADLVQEPLIKADRLQITYVRQETPSQSTVPPMDPILPDVQKVISPPETNIVSRHWHDPNATNLLAAKSKQSVTAKKTKSAADSKDTQAADRSKANAQTKRCDQTAAFSGLLRSLNLAPACDS
jgi:type IV secretory pathway VirB10-like protein